jgi:hypothetical protein
MMGCWGRRRLKGGKIEIIDRAIKEDRKKLSEYESKRVLAALPGPVDLAVIIGPSRFVPAILRAEALGREDSNFQLSTECRLGICCLCQICPRISA